MATRTYLVFKENGKEVLNTQIFGNNFYDSTFFNEVVKLAGMTRFPECRCMEVPVHIIIIIIQVVRIVVVLTLVTVQVVVLVIHHQVGLVVALVVEVAQEVGSLQHGKNSI